MAASGDLSWPRLHRVRRFVDPRLSCRGAGAYTDPCPARVSPSAFGHLCERSFMKPLQHWPSRPQLRDWWVSPSEVGRFPKHRRNDGWFCLIIGDPVAPLLDPGSSGACEFTIRGRKVAGPRWTGFDALPCGCHSGDQITDRLGAPVLTVMGGKLANLTTCRRRKADQRPGALATSGSGWASISASNSATCMCISSSTS